MGRDYYVTVCMACQTAACWHGEVMCDRARRAGVRAYRASELRALSKEHPGNFSREKIRAVEGGVVDVR